MITSSASYFLSTPLMLTGTVVRVCRIGASDHSMWPGARLVDWYMLPFAALLSVLRYPKLNASVAHSPATRRVTRLSSTSQWKGAADMLLVLDFTAADS